MDDDEYEQGDQDDQDEEDDEDDTTSQTDYFPVSHEIILKDHTKVRALTLPFCRTSGLLREGER